MKSAFHNLLIVFALTSLFACGSDTTDTADNSNSDIKIGAKSDTTASMPIAAEIQKPACEKVGKMLDGNEFWAQNVNKLVRIAATDETKDANTEESHRVLQVYDGTDCKLIYQKVLPVDMSPDFAYSIADITYNTDSKIIAIQGVKKIYCYDLLQDKLFRAVEPTFLNERFAEDAQSGQIKRLEVWENYLIGYAQDMGSFVFSLENGQPEVVEPFAEYEILEGERYNSMFLLKSKNKTYQAIVPTCDVNTMEFKVNPILPEPLYISSVINPRYRNNRFQLLQEVISDTEKNVIAVDMKTSKRVELPAGISKQKNTEILAWLKGNVK